MRLHPNVFVVVNAILEFSIFRRRVCELELKNKRALSSAPEEIAKKRRGSFYLRTYNYMNLNKILCHNR